MENSYCIGTANRFSLLFENESDPLETTIKVQEKDLKKKTKVSEKENKGKTEAPAKTNKTTQPPRKVIKETTQKVQENKREGEGKQSSRTESNKPDRPFNKSNNENREERNNRRNREERPFNGGSFENNREREDRPKRETPAAGGDFESRRGRGVGGTKGTGRGGPRRQTDDRRGKREFDRQSGSDKTHGYRGVKPIDKRDGGGAHNWGSHKDVIDEADQSKVNDVDAAWGDVEKPDPVNTTTESKEGGEPEAETVPVEEDRKELTLDEWKAQRAGRQKPTYNVRKAGEGEDPTQWKKMYELNKKKGGEDESDDDEYDTSEYPQRVGRQKHVVGIDFHFNDSSRRGGAGRGRGARAGRGARISRESRGGGSGGAGDKPGGGNNRFRAEDQGRVEDRHDPRNALKVDDERDFPSLG